MKNTALGILAAVLFAMLSVNTASSVVAALQDAGVMFLGELRTGTVTCTTSGVLVAPAGARSINFVGPATAVYIGGVGVDGSSSGLRGLSVCASGCDYVNLAIDVGRAVCATTSGTTATEYTYGVQ